MIRIDKNSRQYHSYNASNNNDSTTVIDWDNSVNKMSGYLLLYGERPYPPGRIEISTAATRPGPGPCADPGPSPCADALSVCLVLERR